MKDKEKQIEEMARELCPYGANKDYYRSCEICKSALMTGCDVFNKAKKLYNKILPEDSVVLSKEEYDKLCHLAYFGYDDYYEKGSKETAEKILNEMFECINSFGVDYVDIREKLKEIATRKGVEIKEMIDNEHF